MIEFPNARKFIYVGGWAEILPRFFLHGIEEMPHSPQGSPSFPDRLKNRQKSFTLYLRVSICTLSNKFFSTNVKSVEQSLALTIVNRFTGLELSQRLFVFCTVGFEYTVLTVLLIVCIVITNYIAKDKDLYSLMSKLTWYEFWNKSNLSVLFSLNWRPSNGTLLGRKNVDKKKEAYF